MRFFFLPYVVVGLFCRFGFGFWDGTGGNLGKTHTYLYTRYTAATAVLKYLEKRDEQIERVVSKKSVFGFFLFFLPSC